MNQLFWKVKDKLYYYLVDKNWGVGPEYHRYVDTHQEEHLNSRWKSWWLLLRLNWHYRILRKTEPLLKNKKNHPKNKLKIPSIKRPESSYSKRKEAFLVAKELLKYDVISFDIFDTLIIRSIDKPTDLFILLEKEHKIFNFAKLRKDAEEYTRADKAEKCGTRDVNIYDIYNYIEKESGLNSYYGIKKEFEFECNVCFANKYMQDIYNILKEENKRIIITSDMYIPENLMKILLEKCGYKGYEKLYVSCDHQKSKREGSLYELIRSEFGEDKKICHIGDNRISDIKMAKQAGFDTIFYKSIRDIGNPFRTDAMSPLVGSFYKGIVNSHLHADSKQYSLQYEYGFIYGGIYVLGYVNWIHEYLKKNNIDKVVFLARDSDILKTIFDKRFNDIKSCYFYWGRLPSFKYSLKYDRYAYFKRNIDDRVNRNAGINIETLFELLGIKFLIKYLEKYHLKKENLLNKSNSPIVKKCIFENLKEIESVYQLEMEIAKEYAKKIIGNSKKTAIVDIGWKGTEPTNLKRLLNLWNIGGEIHCLMAASYGNDWNVQDGTFDVYMFSKIHNVEHLKFLSKNISYYTLAIELFGRMNCEPRFKGFSVRNNNIKFEFENLLVENISDQKEIERGIFDFVNLYLDKLTKFNYLYNISGYDAYCPSKMLERKYKWLEYIFGNHKIELDAGDNLKNIRSYKEYIFENKF